MFVVPRVCVYIGLLKATLIVITLSASDIFIANLWTVYQTGLFKSATLEPHTVVAIFMVTK